MAVKNIEMVFNTLATDEVCLKWTLHIVHSTRNMAKYQNDTIEGTVVPHSKNKKNINKSITTNVH